MLYATVSKKIYVIIMPSVIEQTFDDFKQEVTMLIRAHRSTGGLAPGVNSKFDLLECRVTYLDGVNRNIQFMNERKRFFQDGYLSSLKDQEVLDRLSKETKQLVVEFRSCFESIDTLKLVTLEPKHIKAAEVCECLYYIKTNT